VLKEFSDEYKIQFYLFRDHDQIAGTMIDLPPAVRERLEERPGMNPPPRPEGQRPFPGGPPPGGLAGPRDGVPRPPPVDGRKFMVHTTSPNRYWVVTHLPLPMPEGPLQRPGLAALLASSESLSGGGLFFDLTTWVVAGVAVVFVSVLFWFPLVRGITHAVSRMTAATERIAEGHFDERTRIQRRDELGLLGDASYEFAFRPFPEHELRVADVAWTTSERYEKIDDDDNLQGAPEIVVEVLSPSNTVSEMVEKRELCFSAGCREFWIIDPKKRFIEVTSVGGGPHVYRASDRIAIGSSMYSVDEILGR